MKLSTFKVPPIVILGVSQKRTQIMKQFHIVASAMNLLSFMSMVATIILLGIPMMVTAQIKYL